MLIVTMKRIRNVPTMSKDVWFRCREYNCASFSCTSHYTFFSDNWPIINYYRWKFSV